MPAGPSIYGLFDSKGKLLYVGKAIDPAKRLKGHMRDSMRRQTPLYAWIRKNGQPEIRVIESDCTDWAEAERRIIAECRARGDSLLNVADGGDEPKCDIAVRSANAQMFNQNAGLVQYRRMMVDCGQALKFLKKTQRRQDVAEKLESAMAILRALPTDKKIVAGMRWPY